MIIEDPSQRSCRAGTHVPKSHLVSEFDLGAQTVLFIYLFPASVFLGIVGFDPMTSYGSEMDTSGCGTTARIHSKAG